jgi:Flp pilus assembly protein TadB
MENAVVKIWVVLLPIIMFFLTLTLFSVFFSKDNRVRKAILKAGNVVLSEKELQRRKHGKIISLVAELMPKIEKVVDFEKILGYDLRKMLTLMGEKKKPEHVYADHIVTALVASSTLLIIPFLTKSIGYIFLYPLGVMAIMFGQSQMVKKRYRAWQTEVVKDIPELIDKMRICLASGKDYISALKKVQENSGPRLSNILDKLINDMQIMRPNQALDEFANAFGMPVMIKFVAAIKVGIEVGYEQAENYFVHIEQDIRELRKVALEELTKNKPEKVIILKALMITHAMAALAFTAVNLFKNINQIF